MLPLMNDSAANTEFAYPLEHVSDADLLADTRRLVGRSNQLLAELLAHLAEIEARGIHRPRACSSLYTYCVYELRWSEDAALVLLAPHLTEENHRELLTLAKHRTKPEVLRLVRTIAPAECA